MLKRRGKRKGEMGEQESFLPDAKTESLLGSRESQKKKTKMEGLFVCQDNDYGGRPYFFVFLPKWNFFFAFSKEGK